MSTIILIIAVVVELAFAAYCIFTKSSQARVRDFIRAGAFAAFVLFALASVVQWSFRWVLLAALLFVWAVLGAWSLARNRAAKNGYGPGRTVFKALAGVVLVGLVLTPALIFPQYQQPRATGPHPVGTVNYTFTDQNRLETFSKTGGNREVNVEFWYPKDGAGKYPLVVFSHGAFGMKTSNTSTFVDLASNGFVVCAIDHPYHALFTMDASRHVTIADPGYLQQVQNANAGKYDEATTFKLESQWMGLQVADIKFVLDTVLAQSKSASSDPVYQLIDIEKIGLLGHSLGGESAAEVGRERNDIGAVVNLDADLHGEYVDYGTGKPVINAQPYPAPILTIYSDTVAQRIAAVPDANDVIAVKHVAATAPKAFEVHLSGTDHMSLTDLPLVSPALVSLINASVPKAAGRETDPLGTIEKMNGITLAFFNTYLKGQGTFTYAGTY
jgi:dienelactone hydrolase